MSMALPILVLLSACILPEVWTEPKPDKNVNIHLDDLANAAGTEGDNGDYADEKSQDGGPVLINIPAEAIVPGANKGMSSSVDLSKVSDDAMKAAVASVKQEMSNRGLDKDKDKDKANRAWPRPRCPGCSPP